MVRYAGGVARGMSLDTALMRLLGVRPLDTALMRLLGVRPLDTARKCACSG